VEEHLPVPQQAPVLSTELLETIEAARRFEELARASNTRRGYGSDWNDFVTYCGRHNFPTLPSTDRAVELYITYLAYARKPALNPATIGRRLAAIAARHRDAGFTSPTEMVVVRNAWAGIRRATRVKPKPKQSIVIAELLRLLEAIPADKPAGLRDRAILLLGWSAALRRSELVALHYRDVAFDTNGAVITIQYSKTNQEGDPERIPVSNGSDPLTCPVTALKRWLDASGIRDGALFRRIDRHGNLSVTGLAPAAVAEIVKRAAEKAGLDPTVVAGHSLRSGFVTTARRKGRSDWSIRRITRHKSSAMLDRYTHGRDLWEDAANRDLGL
jgi:integrase